MSLAPGGRLGPYEILGRLGAGGMGEVWRARDARLERDVAIKALPEALAHDAERTARFEREARLLARLNHPAIGGIHGLEESGGRRYLVLEFVEGETLEQRLARAPLPLDEALAIAREIAAALEFAHEAGVVHRDLKPGNVMVRPDGSVKVLDFGLAKALSGEEGETAAPHSSMSPTVTSLGTQVGVLLGTGAYMAPEQAKGRVADRRADIWAFGVVLWEMLTRRRLFAGETISETLALVMMQPIPWDTLPASLPARVVDLLRRCLERDPRRRLQAIGEARIALEGDASSLVSGAAPAPPAASASSIPAAAPATAGRTPRLLTLFAGLVGAAAAVAFMTFLGPRGRAPSPPLQLSVALPPTDYLTGGSEHNLLAISPDGTTLAYTARRDQELHLFLRSLTRRETRLVPGSEDANTPFFSPDGKWVAFFASGHLRKVAVDGGNPMDVCEVQVNRGGCWPTDGEIVLSPGTTTTLFRVPAQGGTPRPLTTLDSTRDERTHRWPLALPGGEWIAFSVGVLNQPAAYDDAEIDAVSLKTGERRRIAHGSTPRWSPDGRLLVSRKGTLFGLRIDPRNPRSAERVEPLLDGVSGEPTSGADFYDVARNGTLAYLPGAPGHDLTRLVWVDLDGRVTPTGLPPQVYVLVALAPDRNRVLATVGPGGGSSHLWLGDLARGTLRQITAGKSESTVLWYPDGDHFVYTRQAANGGEDVVVQSITDENLPRSIFSSTVPLLLSGITPDGRSLLFTALGATTPIQLLPLDGSAPPHPEFPQADLGSAGAVSPDGRWIAYQQSTRTGRREVYVRPFGRPGTVWPVTSTGGRVPVWSADGRTLFVVSGENMTAVSVTADGARLSLGESRTLFHIPPLPGEVSIRDFDYDPVGHRFLMRYPLAGADDRREIAVIIGWTKGRR